MRASHLLGLALVAPAAIAALTLTVFLGAGLLIVFAEPAFHHAPVPARTRVGRPSARHPGAWHRAPIAPRGAR